jgi:hypothetical protein
MNFGAAASTTSGTHKQDSSSWISVLGIELIIHAGSFQVVNSRNKQRMEMLSFNFILSYFFLFFFWSNHTWKTRWWFRNKWYLMFIHFTSMNI